WSVNKQAGGGLKVGGKLKANNLSQDPTAKITEIIAGTGSGQYGQFNVSTISLDGNFVPNFQNYQTIPGDRFPNVIVFNTESGDFAVPNPIDLGNGLGLDRIFNPGPPEDMTLMTTPFTTTTVGGIGHIHGNEGSVFATV